ncbi:hypothetical protein LOZ66_001467 [Ophidiomyces ophidiicola]|nr:hypothetical protein LOZ66_001467 [Ophidiomyces ophidiicola]
MDEFAQTRGVDDLFDDEIIPILPSQAAAEYPDDNSPYSNSQQSDQATPHTPQDPPPPDSGSGFSRTRRYHRNRAPRGALYAKVPKAAGRDITTTKENVNGAHVATQGVGDSLLDKDTPPADESVVVGEDDNDMKQKDITKQKVPAVRGDRSGTGGVKKPKLTEEELSERVAAIKIAAAKRAAAHARAEADEASFNQREKIAAEKRSQERQIHRAMVSERERNRQRKLQAQTGREWDAEKSQELPGNDGSAYRRGMHGSVANQTRKTDSLMPLDDNEKVYGNGYRGRGHRGDRGGRARGYGRGRDRGGYNRGSNELSTHAPLKDADNVQQVLSIEAENEFPALPSSKNDETGSRVPGEQPAPGNMNLDTPLSPVPLKGSWADHVDELHEAEAQKTAQAA